MKQYIVDAFTDKVFHGNQAAVCVLDAWLPDERKILSVAPAIVILFRIGQICLARMNWSLIRPLVVAAHFIAAGKAAKFLWPARQLSTQ